MTEQQREGDLLAGLLNLSEGQGSSGMAARHHSAPIFPTPAMTRHDEQALLNEANQFGTPTLKPVDEADQQQPESFASDLLDVIRRYPLPAVLAGAGLVFLLARRRR